MAEPHQPERRHRAGHEPVQEFLVGHFQQRSQRYQLRVVDQDIDAAKGLGDLLHVALKVVLRGDLTQEGLGGPAAAANLGDGVLGLG